MGWNIDIDWTSAATVSNAPSFVAVSDIYDAFLERYKAINSPAITEPPMLNGTVETLDAALRALLLGGEWWGLPLTGAYTMHYVDIGSSGIIDFDNVASVPPVWTIASLETEIGAELPSVNGPPGAWAWWWYTALNLCTVIQRRINGDDNIAPAGFQYYWKTATSGSWAQAVTAFNAEPWAVYSAQWSVNHFARRRGTFGLYDIFRWRILVPGASGNSVYYAPSVLYAGNYTMAAYNIMGAIDGEYVNNDYAVDDGNYGLIYSDLTPTANVDGKYQSDINIGNFDDATVTEPVVYDVLDGYAMTTQKQRTLIDCGVSGGFDYT